MNFNCNINIKKFYFTILHACLKLPTCLLDI